MRLKIRKLSNYIVPVLALMLMILVPHLSAGELLLHWRFGPEGGLSEEDASAHGHDGQLLRCSSHYLRPDPERVDDGIKGEKSGSVRLEEGGSVRSLKPLNLPESWTLSFWLNDERSSEDISDRFVLHEHLVMRPQMLGLHEPWYFRKDPDNSGLEAEWTDGRNGDEWKEIRVPAFWRDTHVDRYMGYGWYKTSFYVPEAFADMEHELHFEAVDEQAWVYVNGEYVGEQTVESTGQDTGAIWDKPFTVTVKPEHLRSGEDNLLVVRTHSSEGAAGIFRSVYFIPPEERSLIELGAERVSYTPEGWKHVALAVDPDGASLYLNGVLAAHDEQFRWELEDGGVQLEFAQMGEHFFTGRIDDVRLYDSALPDNRVRELAKAVHPEEDADWIAEYDDRMRELIMAGSLTEERLESVVSLGAPDATALLDTLITVEGREERAYAAWALRLVAGEEALPALIENLDTEDQELFLAVTRSLRRLSDLNVFPDVLVERSDEHAVSLLDRVLRHSADTGLQFASVHALSRIGDQAAYDSLKAAVDMESWRVRRYAAEVLREEGLDPDIDPEAEVADWPMWRYDRRRGAVTQHELPEQLYLNWELHLPEPRRAWPAQEDDFDQLEFDLSYEPVVAGGKIYVPSMVTDSLTAYDLDSGEKLWRRFTDGPVRVPPKVWEGRIYLPSDDGFIYCLNADSGELIWKFQGGPTDRKVLGNERLISMWSVRGGPVIKDGILYFAAGIWSHEGVFIYALDAVTGDVEWANSGSGSRMNLHPHSGAYAFGGVAPQGSLVAAGDKLIVPGGRTTPAVFDRHTGELLYFHYQAGGHGAGGYRVYADDDVFFNPSLRRQFMYSLEGGTGIDEVYTDVVARGVVFGVDGQQPFGQELVPGGLGTQWRGAEVEGLEELHLLSGGRLYGSGRNGMIMGLDVVFTREGLDIEPAWSSQVDGDVYRMLAARDRLFVVTEQGSIFCFGEDERETLAYEYKPALIEKVEDEWTVRAGELVENAERDGGYALMFGVGSGRFLEELIHQSDMHIVAFDPDVEVVSRLRERFSAAGLYGERVAVHHGDAMTARFPEYIAEFIVSEDPVAAGLETGEDFAGVLFRSLRPYGGRIYLPLTGDEQDVFAAAVADAGLEKHRIERHEDHVLLERPGALPGSDSWSHQYSDAANTTYSGDSRVKAPLGITWFGGTDNRRVLPRHGNGPVPQVIAGRLIIMGAHHLTARCVYSGRELWQVELPYVGRYFDTTAHASGANFIGSRYVSTADSVYVITDDDRCLRIDLDSGEKLEEFALPGRRELSGLAGADVENGVGKPYGARITEGDEKRWGHIIAAGDYLVAAAFPHYFDDRNPGRRGNWNATSSDYLVVLDRRNGDIQWVYKASYGIRHNAIAVGDDCVFIIDNLSSQIVDKLHRRGIEPDTDPRILSLGIDKGELQWDYDGEIFGTWLSYSREYDALLEAGRRRSVRSPRDEPDNQMHVRRGEDGHTLWRSRVSHTGPVALHHDQRRIISGTGDKSVDILTGDTFEVPNPLTDIPETWYYRNYYGCGTQNVSKHLITFRSGAAGYTDINNYSGTGNLRGFRAGCTNNLVVADGVLNAPDYTRTCSCSYQNQTSLAFVHMPEVEMWNFNTYLDPLPGTIKRVGFNFGAPGSRIHDGVMWINHPEFERVPGPEVPVEVTPVAGLDRIQWFRNHALEVREANDSYSWVAASGGEGIGRFSLNDLADKTNNTDGGSVYTVRLHFAEPEDVERDKRKFDVLVQGNKVLDGLDIVARTTGAGRAYVAEFNDVSPDNDGSITLEFVPRPDSELPSLLSGVEIKIE